MKYNPRVPNGLARVISTIRSCCVTFRYLHARRLQEESIPSDTKLLRRQFPESSCRWKDGLLQGITHEIAKLDFGLSVCNFSQEEIQVFLRVWLGLSRSASKLEFVSGVRV